MTVRQRAGSETAVKLLQHHQQLGCMQHGGMQHGSMQHSFMLHSGMFGIVAGLSQFGMRYMMVSPGTFTLTWVQLLLHKFGPYQFNTRHLRVVKLQGDTDTRHEARVCTSSFSKQCACATCSRGSQRGHVLLCCTGCNHLCGMLMEEGVWHTTVHCVCNAQQQWLIDNWVGTQFGGKAEKKNRGCT